MDKNSTPELAKENLGPALLVVAWVFAGISLVVILVRTYVRLRIVKGFHLDDWLILLTFVLAVADSIFCTLSVHWGLGRHVQFLRSDQIKYSIKYIYICEGFTIMSPCFGRISYAILLLQLVPPSNFRRKFLWTVIWTQFVVDVGTVIVTFSQCQPVHEFWGINQKEYCWDPRVQQYTGFFQGSVCSVVDLILALFPASLLWKLNMKPSTKISLSTLMGLGVFAMVFSIIKTIKLQALSEKGDPTYALGDLAIWFTLEAYMVLLAASAPTLRPLVRRMGTCSDHVKGQSSSLPLRKLNYSSRESRKKGNDEFYILTEDSPSWPGGNRPDRIVGVGPDSMEVTEDVDGIHKMTTVSVLQESGI